MDNVSANDEADDTGNQLSNNSLKSRDCKEQKRQKIYCLTTQPLRKITSVDILKRIQPLLSERDWIISQRQSHVRPEALKKTYATKDLSTLKLDVKSREFKRAQTRGRMKKRNDSKYEEDNDRGSIHSFDSVICLANLTLNN